MQDLTESTEIEQKDKPVSRRKWGIAIALLAIVGLGVGFFLFTQKNRDSGGTQVIGNSSSTKSSDSEIGQWKQGENGWEPQGKVPACPEPLAFDSFVDTNIATSVLWPGQMRSVGYEPTAGFRFDGVASEAVTVTSPLAGEIIQGARSLANDEIQYTFDLMTPCGIMIRFDHLLEIPAKLQAIADKLPAPKPDDTRSTSITPGVPIAQGETVATAVGMRQNKNTFLSITFFDFRQKNKISQTNPAWAEEHPSYDQHVICPFPYLPEKDQARIKTLPAADSISGSKSDFCE